MKPIRGGTPGRLCRLTVMGERANEMSNQFRDLEPFALAEQARTGLRERSEREAEKVIARSLRLVFELCHRSPRCCPSRTPMTLKGLSANPICSLN
jgi:hypothetical protein